VRLESGTAPTAGSATAGPAGIGVAVNGSGATATISGGSVTVGDGGIGVDVGGFSTATTTISGGSLTAGPGGAGVHVGISGTATISGCNLLLSAGQLSGILLDGTAINTGVRIDAPGRIILDEHCLCADDTTPPALSSPSVAPTTLGEPGGTVKVSVTAIDPGPNACGVASV